MESPAETQKVLTCCKLLNSTPAKITPKRFLQIFLDSGSSEIAYLRRLWAQPRGISSTMDLVHLLRREILSTPEGSKEWTAFIQEEAIQILVSQEAPRGNYPNGSFHSSLTVKGSFFDSREQLIQQSLMTEEHMPFLYGLINGMLRARVVAQAHVGGEDEAEDESLDDDQLSTPQGFGEVRYYQGLSGVERVHARFARIASTVCSMVAFAHNRRHNALQLNNAVRFTACGVSERVHDYLHYLGLCSSRRTAMSALKTLSIEGQEAIKEVMSIQANIPIAPTICIDNIDMEQGVHNLSVGNRSKTFRGTWGYVHVPNISLIRSLNPEELTLAAYRESLIKAKSFSIEPKHFLPSHEAALSEMRVWKSQIAKVLMDHIAVPSVKCTSIPTEPPAIEVISNEKPTIHMLKLMDVSDNSAESIGQVFSTLLLQSGLTAEEFYGRLQPMDGDLGTVQNFNSLRSQRTPSPYGKESLNNIVFQLGASHTLWNVASTIFSHHFGDSSDQSNVGAWQFLEALGFPSEKAIQKKDFTLMINQMERILEATLYYCLRVVMKTQYQEAGEKRITISSEQWNTIVDTCYKRFCSPEARSAADLVSNPKLSNTMIMLHDFSSVVEAKRAMQAGDIGRLMMVWKKWCIMTQGLKGLTNYSSYLPRMVLLLTEILPPGLSKFLKHNLLFSPTGRKGHFVAKDNYLECQNYWLKYVYNNTGNGTKIDRLQDLFSVNIILHKMTYAVRLIHSVTEDV
ncbi:uncharacterized protein PGTG_17611 [Puccinia graminis f. sp. tritici CRL 75-36-700-3]|uniref:DUF6589 domain-containing protein n=1 Tax=Puccinia graminis f. sp. tritici (strain CRL 75-36-700-3 / race SCCL) TaxID=418459 RepID=E3L4T2_PUCGT|nr:uncharacterized protein PGTG_17611 [Puccinia graminis f. sp. tritici CRL 75-36-700-3]EFP91557.1 hypothetical protein PGTG_17611 [Puccinia graminis f. sp. tritici CRL 75-36-700-3]